jgi:hypothetical protein
MNKIYKWLEYKEEVKVKELILNYDNKYIEFESKIIALP